MLPSITPEEFNMIRTERSTALFFPGPRVFLLGESYIVCTNPSLARFKVEVDSLTMKRVVALDDADQTALGFSTFQRFQNFVVDTYPELTPDSVVTIARLHR